MAPPTRTSVDGTHYLIEVIKTLEAQKDLVRLDSLRITDRVIEAVASASGGTERTQLAKDLSEKLQAITQQISKLDDQIEKLRAMNKSAPDVPIRQQLEARHSSQRISSQIKVTPAPTHRQSLPQVGYFSSDRHIITTPGTRTLKKTVAHDSSALVETPEAGSADEILSRGRSTIESDRNHQLPERNRDDRVQTIHARGSYDSPTNYPTIVRSPGGEWVELRCPACGGNSKDGSQFIKGLLGFRGHLRQAHISTMDAVGKDKDWILEKCRYRVWAPEELSSRRAKIANVSILVDEQATKLNKRRRSASEESLSDRAREDMNDIYSRHATKRANHNAAEDDAIGDSTASENGIISTK